MAHSSHTNCICRSMNISFWSLWITLPYYFTDFTEFSELEGAPQGSLSPTLKWMAPVLLSWFIWISIYLLKAYLSHMPMLCNQRLAALWLELDVKLTLTSWSEGRRDTHCCCFRAGTFFWGAGQKLWVSPMDSVRVLIPECLKVSVTLKHSLLVVLPEPVEESC